MESSPSADMKGNYRMFLNIDGYEINYKITGDGENTLVILQGWGTELAVYDSVAACVSSKYKVVQFELPGFGQSTEPTESWNVEEYAQFFTKFMAALGISKATLLGHSYGGRIIIRLAAKEDLPFTIDRIVLVDSAGVLPEKTPAQKRSIRRYKMLKKIVNTKLANLICPELIEEWRSHQGSADYRAASPIMRQALVKAVNEDLTPLLPKIQQDTLLIWGDQDDATPISDAKVMEAKIPQSGLAVIPGTGHYCFLEQPATFKRIMQSYFQIEEE